MALRVLLADESTTIKKVMQLALQDFNVEVKSVPVGLDVVDVTRSFNPDIIFADILLAKKNGYEVCAELKSNPSLHKVPVVLMWSSFMEFDEAKAAISKPNARLEKPFDAEALRTLVRDLVPKLQNNVISQYLSFPNLPPIVEEPKIAPPASATPPPQLETHEPESVELEDLEDFQQVPLPKAPGKRTQVPIADLASSESRTDDQWARQDLGQFKIDVHDEDLTSDYELAAQNLGESTIATMSSGLEEVELAKIDLPVIPAQQTNKKSNSKDNLVGDLPSMTQLSHERLEQLVREEARKTLETIAWKILPDITERIVREEIQKLLKDAEKI